LATERGADAFQTEQALTTAPLSRRFVHVGVQEQDDHVKLDGRSKEDVMEATSLLDCAGRRRSPATMSSFHEGLSPRNKGLRYPPDPPTVEEIVAVMRAAGENAEGVRLRSIIVVLWRAGLRISEALALNETDLDPVRG
jgi:integrase